MRANHTRFGYTLIEVLVVIAIIAILVGLLVVAVVRVRENANIAQSKNNLHQIALGTHHYASAHQGSLPKLGPFGVVRDSTGVVILVQAASRGTPSLFVDILPYIDAPNAKSPRGKFSVISLFLSPSDPTAGEAMAKSAAVSSYGANAEVFLENPHSVRTYTDGASNTIAFGEHYAFDCHGHDFPYWIVGGLHHRVYGAHSHRPSFADLGDLVPVTQGNPPESMPSHMANPPPANTFQVAPSTRGCRSYLAQTPHSSGMLVAMGDGSVRQLSPAISPAMFWAAVTPNKSDVPNLD